MNRVERRIMEEMKEEQGWKRFQGDEKYMNPYTLVDVKTRSGYVISGVEIQNVDWFIGELPRTTDIVYWRLHEKRFREEIPDLMGKVYGGSEELRDNIKESNMDAVNPKHYKDIVPGYEYFDIMDHMLSDWHGSQAHALGNALKYLMRLNKKDSIPQELGKAIWYLERLKKDVEEKGKL